MFKRFFVAAICPLILASAAVAQQQLFADLGDFKLQSGGVLRECRIGYRTHGQLNDAKSNAVLIPTWAGGTTADMEEMIKAKLPDPATYFVITVDALSDGVSSSPSNSRLQPRMQFPRVTIRDMVETQHALLTRVLGINHVHAVIGLSMGGMQTFQWMVAYPDFMDKAIPIVGSPRLTPYDLVAWQAQIDAITHDANWNGGNYTKNPARAAEEEFGDLLLSTPADFNSKMTHEKILQLLSTADTRMIGLDANDKIRQAQAMMDLDVSAAFGGSMQRAAAAVKADTMIVVSTSDLTVIPQPAIDFAKLMNATLVEFNDDCGHGAPSCEFPKLSTAVSSFLAYH